MSKIAAYLNEHLVGEISSSKSVRKLYSTDASILTITPEIVAFPKVSNDIRKIARFSWQLAEKGHAVPITVRGFGGDTTGAAIGKGVLIDTSKYLNSIIQIAVKDKLVHVQPGISLSALDTALKWQGLSLPGSSSRSTKQVSVGGSIATDSLGVNGSVADNIEKLEIILANGDVIETGKLSKRDLSKKQGLQTFEGEIYRKIEALFEDNQELLKNLREDSVRDNTGYKRIAEVIDKDGSLDLTPLFIGSQGTLGIISELVLRTDFYSQDEIQVVIEVQSNQAGRDLADKIYSLQPSELTIIDGDLLRTAVKSGTRINLLGSIDQVGAVVYVRFNDFSDRAQNHKYKKLKKLLKKSGTGFIDSLNRDPQDFLPITDIKNVLELCADDDNVPVPLIDGALVPARRQEEFEKSLKDLEAKHHVKLPLVQNALTGTYYISTPLSLDSVSDKQKIFKLMNEYATLVDKCGGAFASDGAEGRLKANAAWSTLDEKTADLYEQVRKIFDPLDTLNPGVKQETELRSLVAMLRSNYDSSSVV